MRGAAAVLTLLISTTPAPARAQVTTTGNIRVVVSDQAGLSIPGATVTAAAEDAATTRVGINVTDGVSGTFGANLNTEIIQEQQVLTGGIPAEYVGAPGLLSSVITKSGTNQLSGSVNYFFQNDGLVAENRNASDQEFSRFDTALTGGGPIITDHAWFFGSYRRLGSNGTVVALDGIDVIRTVEEQQDQFYARGTWAPSTNETLGFTFLNDPTEVSGSRDRDVTNARDSSRVQGGNNYHLKYTRLFGDLLVEGSYSRHNGEVSGFAALPGSRNSIVFRDTVFDGGLYTSLAGSLAGLSAAELFAGSFSDTRFDPSNSSDHSGFVRTVDQLPDRAAFYSRYDLDGDGVISQEELASGLTFASMAGNPSYGIVDVRLLYNYRLAGYRVELFADVFNLLDNQDAIRNQDLLAGAGGNAFGDGIRFTPPRRVFIGARLNFG